MKKIIAGIGVVALALVAASPASAAIVRNIGDNSVGSILTMFGATFNFSTSNTANISNNVTTSSNTGGNIVMSDDDQRDTQLTSGAASSGSAVENAANTTMVSTELDTPDTTGDVVEAVNDDSSGSITTTDTLDDQFDATNDVTVDNAVDASSQTGLNQVISGDSLLNTKLNTGIGDSATVVSNAFNLTVKEILRKIRIP